MFFEVLSVICLFHILQVGRNQIYSLGQTIRSLYNGFADEEYDEDDFSVSTTTADESWMSGLLFAAGLYPPVDYEVWNADLLWQPIIPDNTAADKTLVRVWKSGTKRGVLG